ncbi:hypothetical protein AVEN_58729-1 [Araneus ventricosus]|uniref:Transposase Tc1-like domain-containing protein n=1 Tax=Araneus ventricosus TaxID=182803 RepID=A0A4Y2UFE8_ARAVE|nr:hypothetical protein AVEN_58729-1 [Araneus ventricosus]
MRVENPNTTGCLHKAKRRSGRPRVTNKRDDRQIQRLSSTQQMTVRDVQRSSGLSVSKDTIRRRILGTGTMIHCKMKKKPALKPQNNSQRMLWARTHYVIRTERAISDIKL